MKNKLGFTLLELLVVVLIIGILAAIALPQYQKIILKTRLHSGISIVASLYQAEQDYFLVNGTFTEDIDSLVLEIPKDESCRKKQTSTYSGYFCDFGEMSLDNGLRSVSFFDAKNRIAYLHFLTDMSSSNVEGGKFKKGVRYCCSHKPDSVAQGVCESMNSIYVGESSSWKYYELR